MLFLCCKWNIVDRYESQHCRTPEFKNLLSRVKSKVNGLGSKWTVHGGLTERSKRLKVDGQISKWTVWERGRSEIKKTRQPKWMKLDEWNLRDEIGRSNKLKVSSRTVHFGANDRPVWLKTVHFRAFGPPTLYLTQYLYPKETLPRKFVYDNPKSFSESHLLERIIDVSLPFLVQLIRSSYR